MIESLQHVTAQELPRRMAVARAVSVGLIPESIALQLLVINILLQIFDGTATYGGLNLGLHEANPILRSAFGVWGVGPTLLLFKVGACALLVWLYRNADRQIIVPAFGLLALVHCVCSFIPWIALLAVRLAAGL